jgi:hypothetical protein
MELKSGQEAMLPAIAMTIYYRDLDTLEPLEEVVRNGEIRVRGRADADLDLSLLEKLALRRWSGHADVPIDDRIEVSLPGGFAGRAAALLALNAGEAAMDLAGSTLNALRITQRKWNGELKTEFGESLLIVESSYRMRTTEGQELAGNLRSLGFRIADGRVLITAETAEPWKYDVDTMESLRSKKATIIENSHNIAVWAPNGNIDSAASLANGRLRVEKIATSEESVIVREDGKNRTVPVAKRDARSNYALLRFAEEQEKRGGIPVEPTRADQMWDRVAVFKLNSDGTIETIFIPARRQGDRLILDTPVDDGTFGSPIVVPGGAIGMVQDEHSGMVLPTKW